MATLVDVVNAQNETVDRCELPDAVFAAPVKPHLLHEVVRMQLAGRRQGTADTKGRSEVSGGGKKPWKQKGTGRARAGTIRSPLWRHGGTVFGPHPRSYAYGVPKAVRRQALLGALTAKAQSGAIRILDFGWTVAGKANAVYVLGQPFRVTSVHRPVSSKIRAPADATA